MSSQSTNLEGALQLAFADAFAHICVLDVIDSTNAEAIRRINAGQEARQIVVALSQSAGRGRRGRHWLSPAGAGIYLTFTWDFAESVTALQALSLVTAISVQQAIAGQGLSNVQLKWPNDILVAEQKLAGILLETCNTEKGVVIVFGVGINLDLPDETITQIDRPITDMRRAGSQQADLSVLLTELLQRWQRNVAIFQVQGFAPFMDSWNELDSYNGREVTVSGGTRHWQGVSQGVDETGALVVLTDDGIQQISGGEVLPTLRPTGRDSHADA